MYIWIQFSLLIACLAVYHNNTTLSKLTLMYLLTPDLLAFLHYSAVISFVIWYLSTIFESVLLSHLSLSLSLSFWHHTYVLLRKKAGDVRDQSMYIYYDFDEGPGSSIIKNHGTAGSTADLQNGKIFDGDLYSELISTELRVPSPGYWVSFCFYLMYTMYIN